MSLKGLLLFFCRSIIFTILLIVLPFHGLTQSKLSPGTIKGTVVNDRDQTLSQAIVILFGGPNDIQRETNTDGDGKFEFSSLSNGNYRIEVVAEDYVISVRGQIELLGTAVEINISLEREITTIREVEERGVRERNPNIFIRKLDLNALRDPIWRRGIEPVFLQKSAAENQMLYFEHILLV